MIDLIGRSTAPADHVVPPDRGESWDRDDLVRRVRQALDIAGRVVASAVGRESQTEPERGQISDRDSEAAPSEIRPLVVAKVVAEATMLLRSAAFLGETDDQIARAVDELARRLDPYARGDSLLAALCREPALALDHAAAHIHLSDLGYRDALVNHLLVEILEGEDIGGPERLPNHELEHQWLSQIRSGGNRSASGDGGEAHVSADLVARTCIARPLDALGSATSDLYAFTHVVLYTTDMGRRSTRSIEWPRPIEEIVRDAEAALAAAVDADNYDLAAELLWTWPMLGLPWSPAATFGFGILAAAQDANGFLPGPGYSARDCRLLPSDLGDEYVLRTSYHATFVMGFLCAAALRPGLAPPTGIPVAASAGAIDSILPLIRTDGRGPGWQHSFLQLDITRRESLAEFLLSIALRRARAAQDLELVRGGLLAALHCDLVDAPAAHQALALLRRATLLGQMSG